MVLGSHNTMSYLKPQWYVRPFAFVARCQSETLDEQIKRGVKLFDLRVYFDKHDTPHFAHGAASYDGANVHDVLSKLNELSKNLFVRGKERIIVRVMNERNNKEEVFGYFCRRIDQDYGYIQFCGFRNKNGQGAMIPWTYRADPTKKEYGDYGQSERLINFIDKYSSNNTHVPNKCTGTYADDWCPWIFARLFNSKWRKAYQDQDIILMQDFVGQY